MIEKHPAFKKSDVTAESCAWIAQIETRELTPEDLKAFREWIQRTPRHASEIRRLAMLSSDLNVLTEMAGPLEHAARQSQPTAKKRWRRGWLRPAGVLVALAAAAVLAGGAFLRVTAPSAPVGPVMVATAIGDYEDSVLADGTGLQLNSDSQVEIDFTAEERTVRLLKGEAFFEVAHDPARPFVVYVRDKYVWAVGTAFGVRLLEDDFEVTVTHGRVALAETAAPPALGDNAPAAIEVEAVADTRLATAQPIILRAGQSVVLSSFEDPPPIVDMTERELMRKLSWQENLLEFFETPLAEVISEVSRHTTMQIEIADSELKSLEFGGIFRTGDTDALLDALAASYEIEIEYVSDNAVRLKRRTNG